MNYNEEFKRNIRLKINSLGFPIACVCVLGIYFVQKDKTSREDIAINI